jgi:hypothetical protein
MPILPLGHCLWCRNHSSVANDRFIYFAVLIRTYSHETSEYLSIFHRKSGAIISGFSLTLNFTLRQQLDTELLAMRAERLNNRLPACLPACLFACLPACLASFRRVPNIITGWG